MKYLRKIVYALLAVIMVAAFVIGMGAIFAVKNVNVTLISYSYEEDSPQAVEKIARFKTDILSKTRGTMISFVGDEAVTSAITDDGYVVEYFEKVYPCTLNVTVRERREVYVVAEGEENFRIYDEKGVFLRKAEYEEQSYNKLDGEPNLTVKTDGAISLNAEALEKVATVCAVFEEKFTALRALLDSVTLTRTGITFSFKCGVDMVVYDFEKSATEKIEACRNYFNRLSGGQKTCGTIYCTVTKDEKINVTYSAN